MRHYLPGYKSGGPQTSVLNLCKTLDTEFSFRVVTLDHDLGDPTPYPGITPGRWNRVEGHEVYYLTARERRYAAVRDLIRATPHDLLYLNGIFPTETTIYPLVARRLGQLERKPVILAPRGSFSPNALALKSAKKRLYLGASQALGLYKGITWQASTGMEKEDIQRRLGIPSDQIATAQDLPVRVPTQLPERPLAEMDAKGDAGEAAFRVTFLGRVAPMKNLDFALRCLAQCRRTIRFDIYGPQEDAAYWADCQSLISELPANVVVHYHGTLKPTEVAGLFQNSDLKFLPSRGENYGHVVFEALANGTPVLVSDKTPWRGFPEDVGQVLPLDDPSAFARHIDRLAGLGPNARAELAVRTHAHALELQQTNKDVSDNARMFHHALAHSSISL